MKVTDNITITNEDCMELLKRTPDNFYDLAICDPPYGIGASKPSKKPNKAKQNNGNTLNVKTTEYTHKNWDNEPADADYFKELIRVSKNQIIWGCNYYSFDLSGGRIVWDKMNGESDQFDCEIAYNSLNKRTDIVRFMWSGMIQGLNISKLISKANVQQGNKKLNEKRLHPTQKPVKIYEWLLDNYAKENDKILDTHGGSMSIAIAVHNRNQFEKMNLSLTLCELDEEYFNNGVERVKRHCSQQQLF